MQFLAMDGGNTGGDDSHRLSGWAVRIPCGFGFALLLAMPPALAGSDISLTYGVGADDYRSYSLAANVDLLSSPLQANIDYMTGTSTGAEVTNESGVGLTWRANDWLSANYRFSRIKDDTFEVKGNQIGMSASLDKLWKSDLGTRVDIELAEFGYVANTRRPAIQAIVAALLPDQRRYHAGMSQDISQYAEIYASYDAYRYTRDPVTLVRFLNRRTGNISNAASVLLAFPDRARTVGLAWFPNEKLTFDLSYSGTETVIGQGLEVSRLVVRYRIGSAASINVGAARSFSEAVKNGAGNVVISSSTETSWTVGLTYQFD